MTISTQILVSLFCYGFSLNYIYRWITSLYFACDLVSLCGICMQVCACGILVSDMVNENLKSSLNINWRSWLQINASKKKTWIHYLITISHYDKMFHHWHAMIADRNKNEWMITGAYHFHISTLLVKAIKVAAKLLPTL